MNTTPLSGTNWQLAIIAAHRYALGRRSYIVGAIIEWLRDFWYLADAETRRVIIRDTMEAVLKDQAGSESDREEWRRFANSMMKKLAPYERIMIENDLKHLR